jgi:hypothetical protein
MTPMARITWMGPSAGDMQTIFFLYSMLVSYLYLRFSEYIALEVVLCPAHLCGMLRSLVRSKI